MKYRYQRSPIIKSYARQVEFIEAIERYTLVEATTKAGKTTGCITWLFEQAAGGKKNQHFWWLSPTKAMARDVYNRMRTEVNKPHCLICNKGELTITLPNKTVISFKSAFEPEYLYGRDVHAVVIDEATRMKEELWYAITSVLTKTQGKVKIIGNVKGTGNWVYRFARQAEAGKKDWKYFKITATDAIAAGVLKQEAVDDAQAVLPNDVFLELYYGVPNQKTSNKFCYAFDPEKHIGECKVNYTTKLYISFDFNHNPMCCSLFQLHQNTLFVPACIKLENSSIYALCDEIMRRFKGADFWITGDASGNSQSAWAEDASNYYTVIKNRLKVNPVKMCQPTVNPRQSKNQVLVNAVLEKYRVQIHPTEALALIDDLRFVEVNSDGTIKKDNRNKDHQKADLLDTFRYFCNTWMLDVLPVNAYLY